MNIVAYANKRTEKLCNDFRFAKKELGEQVAERLFATIDFMRSAANLNDLLCIPTYRLHQLKGKRKGEIALDLGRKLGFRLIIKPEPPFSSEEDALDFSSKCISVMCVMVLEVSNHYE